MNNTLLIYDSTGYIIAQMQGAVREPIGIPLLWVDVPVKKRVISIDVSVTPNVPIYETIPPTETELLQADQVDQSVRLLQMETDSMAFQEYILSVLPPV